MKISDFIEQQENNRTRNRNKGKLLEEKIFQDAPFLKNGQVEIEACSEYIAELVIQNIDDIFDTIQETFVPDYEALLKMYQFILISYK